MTPTFTIAVPTIGRETLVHTLDSIARQRLLPGDRVVVVLDTYQEPPRPDVADLVAFYGFELRAHNGGTHFYGNPQLNHAILLAQHEFRTDYFCALGDDDVYVDGAIERLRAKLKPGRATLFQFYAPPYLVPDNPRRFILWADRRLRVANISGCCLAAPTSDLTLVPSDRRCEVDFEWIRATLDRTGQPPRWLKDVLVIARPEFRDGLPVHQGVSICPGCGYVGFTEDFSDRLCRECAPTVIRELLETSA